MAVAIHGLKMLNLSENFYSAAAHREPETVIMFEDPGCEGRWSGSTRAIKREYREFPKQTAVCQQSGWQAWLPSDQTLRKWSLLSLFWVTFASLYLFLIF